MALKNIFSLLKSRPATTPELAGDLIEPQAVTQSETGQARRALSDAFITEPTPTSALRALAGARTLQNVPLFINFAVEVLRRSPHLFSVLQTRALAVRTLELMAEPTGSKLADRKAAEYAKQLVESDPVDGTLTHLLIMGLYLGESFSHMAIERTPTETLLTGIAPVPPHFIVYDRTDAKTPYILPQEAGQPLQPLLENKFISHRAATLSGNPLASGIAYSAVFFEALKLIALKGWVSFTEVYGMPLRVGKFPKGMTETKEGKKNIDVMKQALAQLGGDGWAAFPDDMKIELVEAASRNGSAEVYERLCRYVDEQLAKLVLGGSLTSGTGNTGSGGSRALGSVHNEVRNDILHADAKALATTLRRDLVTPFVRWNFGDGVAIPKLYFLIEKAQDIPGKVKAVCDLVDRGFVVPQAEMYALLDIRAPEGQETVLGAKVQPAPVQPPAVDPKAAMSAQFSSTGRDALDVLVDETIASPEFVEADADADTLLLNAIESAAGGDSNALKKALLALIKSADTAGLQAALVPGTTAARLAGDMGAEIGGA